VPQAVKNAGLKECLRILEEAVDIVKTKQGDAKVILVGGGSIIIGDSIVGVGRVVRPDYFEVANAVGAAVSRPILNALSVHLYLIDWQSQRRCGEDGYPWG
jgi:alcohol dehydrogenase YqhD (iron-dependent ADH family)